MCDAQASDRNARVQILEPRISEHARMRWLERVEMLDVADLDRRILPSKAREMIKIALLEGRPAMTYEGVTYTLAHDGTIVSVWRNGR